MAISTSSDHFCQPQEKNTSVATPISLQYTCVILHHLPSFLTSANYSFQSSTSAQLSSIFSLLFLYLASSSLYKATDLVLILYLALVSMSVKVSGPALCL